MTNDVKYDGDVIADCDSILDLLEQMKQHAEKIKALEQEKKERSNVA